MEQSKRPEIQSEGELAMGDYYWALFNSPQPPFSDTRPVEVATEEPGELLDKAEQHYSAALKNAGVRPYVAPRARFGLAAVAEARGFDAMRKAGFKGTDATAFWEKAREQYQAIVDDPASPQVLKDEAKWHLAELKEVSRPIWVAAPPPSTATSGPTTATTGPSLKDVEEALRKRIEPVRFPPMTAPTTGATTRPAK